MPRIDTATKLCAVMGNPVGHSLSPAMHNAAFEAVSLNFVYVAFQVEDVGGCLTGMRALPGFRGMSVTIPHKVTVMAHLDDIEKPARQVGCVNTITNEAGRLVGSITDGTGTLRAFAEANISLKGKRVLFVGAGGAVRAVAFAMATTAEAEAVTVLGRTASRVEALGRDLAQAAAIPVTWGGLGSDLEAAMATNDVVINGTPMGMYPNAMDKTCVPANYFRAHQVAFDMVYRPHETRFLHEARAAGCVTIPGSEMLVNQAELQFERWTGCAAPPGVMGRALLAQLEAR